MPPLRCGPAGHTLAQRKLQGEIPGAGPPRGTEGQRPGLLVEHVHRADLGSGVVGDLPESDGRHLFDLGLGGQLLAKVVQRLGRLFLSLHRREHGLQLGLLPLELSVLLLDLVPGRLEFLRHGVEPHGQLAELGRATLGYPGGQVSSAQPSHGDGQPLDRTNHHPMQADRRPREQEYGGHQAGHAESQRQRGAVRRLSPAHSAQGLLLTVQRRELIPDQHHRLLGRVGGSEAPGAGEVHPAHLDDR